MNIQINFHKIIEALIKIKFPYFTLFIAFICSFNLWFLSVYFFYHNIFVNQGLIITLLITFALTTSWCLITGITVPKFLILYFMSLKLDINDEILTENQSLINLFIFFEIIVAHSFFIYLQWLCNFKFAIFISITFWTSFLIYMIVDFVLKKKISDELNK